MDDYKKYKPKLREEFSFACAYCETREAELGGSQSFHIDHYKPKNKFPKLSCKYDNLIYACRNCNQYKGSFWPSKIQILLGESIFNPRPLGVIKKHIDPSEHKWVGITNNGKWSIKKLRLDSSILIKRRENRSLLENAIKRLEIINSQNQQNLITAEQEEVEETVIDQIKLEMTQLEKEINAIRYQLMGAKD